MKSTAPEDSGLKKHPIAKFFVYAFLIAYSVTVIVPFAWMVSTSLKGAGDVFTPEMKFWPEDPKWSNYAQVFKEIPFGRQLLNSLIVTCLATLGQVFTSSLAAFAFARLKFPGRNVLFFAYLGTMMIPYAVTMIPLFVIMRLLGDWFPYEFYYQDIWLGNVVGVDSYFALMIPGLFSAYGTFLLRQFFLSIPRDLDEAAIIDGCSKFGVYRHVIIPLSGPALATLTIFVFIGMWRDFMWPLIICHTPAMQTLTVGLSNFKDLYNIQWHLLMADAMMVMLPMIVVFLLNQRFFTEGIKLSGIKG